MADTKLFRTSAVLSLTTGKLIDEFSAVHELAEWLAGHPIWTHEFADKAMNARLRELAFSQYPHLATADASELTKANWQEYRDRWNQHFGASLLIAQGSDERSESPADSLERISARAKGA